METTESILDAIRQHGTDTYPEEGCGFLLGTMMDDGNNRVTALHRATNRRSENRERRYELTADDYREADAAAQEQGLDVVGVYHSHPDHPARPSETDLQEAPFPGYTYVIVSVHDGAPEALTAWALALDRSEFHREEISLRTPEVT
ncbi:M67 family metallopeptidase [Salinibacter altiplanensis]|uniref:M67 family metallopeptidase n=1 Tax=Salinibacter altiplanensis TaxID=1803181 RepID=UPI000C9ECB97|nr:M67 family metallopeptidase [Salinibacter altiplanensis]